MNDPARHTSLDSLGLVLLPLSVAAALLTVPDLSAATVAHPTFAAMVACTGVLALITALRGRGRRGTRIERGTLALFLLLMPTIYLASWLQAGGSHHGWFGVELAGQAAFAVLAFLGWRRAPLLLGVGILAHGTLWDAWHFGRTPFMPDWYAIACGVVDVGCGIYALAQVRAWSAAAQPSLAGADQGDVVFERRLASGAAAP